MASKAEAARTLPGGGLSVPGSHSPMGDAASELSPGIWLFPRRHLWGQLCGGGRMWGLMWGGDWGWAASPTPMKLGPLLAQPWKGGNPQPCAQQRLLGLELFPTPSTFPSDPGEALGMATGPHVSNHGTERLHMGMSGMAGFESLNQAHEGPFSQAQHWWTGLHHSFCCPLMDFPPGQGVGCFLGYRHCRPLCRVPGFAGGTTDRQGR